MQTIVSIQARMGSSRLPGKVLLSLGGDPIISWVVSGCRDADRVDETLVAIGDEPANDAIVGWAQRHDCRYVVGPEENLLERHLRVVSDTDADTLVRVTADSPLLPGAELDRLIAVHRRENAVYTTNYTEQMPVGVVADVIDVDALRTRQQNGDTHPVVYFREHTDDDRVIVSPNPAWRSISEADMEVDTPADYWSLVDAVKAVGADPTDVGTWLLNE